MNTQAVGWLMIVAAFILVAVASDWTPFVLVLRARRRARALWAAWCRQGKRVAR